MSTATEVSAVIRTRLRNRWIADGKTLADAVAALRAAHPRMTATQARDIFEDTTWRLMHATVIADALGFDINPQLVAKT